jgi:succinate dehydrogenase/fumarate reductase cytochrome b subunit
VSVAGVVFVVLGLGVAVSAGVRLWRGRTPALAIAFVVYGLICVVAGIALLSRPTASSGFGAVLLTILTVALGGCGIVGVWLAVRAARDPQAGPTAGSIRSRTLAVLGIAALLLLGVLGWLLIAIALVGVG